MLLRILAAQMTYENSRVSGLRHAWLEFQVYGMRSAGVVRRRLPDACTQILYN